MFLLKFTPRGYVEPRRAVVQRALLWLFEAVAGRVSRWSRWRTVLGELRSKKDIYGNLWYWPFATLSQAFMLSFNLGAWGWFILAVAGEDLAFAWQSSLMSSPEHVHTVVHWLSAPWAWLVSDVSPTLEEIRTSQFLKAQGIGGLPNASVKAWIPFVFGVVATYGVGVRIVMLAATRFWFERRAIARLRFEHADARRILDRMRRDAVSISAAPAGSTPTTILTGSMEPATCEPLVDSANVLLLWGLGSKDASSVRTWAQQHLGWQDARVHSIPPPEAGQWTPAATTQEIVLAVNARRPPSGDFRALVERAVGGTKPPRVRVLAIAGGCEDRAIWASELKSVGSAFIDPNVLELTQ